MSWHRQFQFRRANAAGRQSLSPAEILSLLREPALRMQDVPHADALAQQLMLEPGDAPLLELFELTVREQHGKAMLGDAFHGNLPSTGQLPPLESGRIPLFSLPNGQVLSKAARPFTNVLLSGPTGGGKTTLLRLLAASLLLSGAIVIVFSPKEDFIDCELLVQQQGVHVLYPEEAPIALFQPVPGQELAGFVQTRVELLGKHQHLEASKRLMLEALHLLFRRPRAPRTWPTLSELLDMLDNLRLDPSSRKGQYKEALQYALRQIQLSLGKAVDWAASDFLQRVLSSSRPACYVFQTGGLMAEMAALYASLFVDFAFTSRGLQSRDDAPLKTQPPIVFVLDDSIPLLRGGHASEAEGSGANPVATWAWLGRSRGIHLIGAVQSYSVVSPAFKANCPCVLCIGGAYGRDAEELARDLALTREQAAMLPVLQPGWCVGIDRATWPLALLGKVPEVR